MTPCTCDKWMEKGALLLKRYGPLIAKTFGDGFTFCPFCGASLTAPEKPREEAERRDFSGVERMAHNEAKRRFRG